MNPKQEQALILRETDVQGVLRRFNGNSRMYASCLQLFLEDETIRQLNAAVKQTAWDDAFTAAHALKGLAGNMGFVPLMHASGQLVVLIRGGRTKEVDGQMALVNSSYRDITDGIRDYFAREDLEGESK